MPKDMQRLKVPDFFSLENGWIRFNRMVDCQCILTLLDSASFFSRRRF